MPWDGVAYLANEIIGFAGREVAVGAMNIATQRLMLREFEAGDIDAIYVYHADPLYLRYYPWTSRTRDDVEALIGRLVAWSQERPRSKFQLAVVLESDGAVIGNCGIRMEAAHGYEAELGCEINPRYWGLGYGTEAIQAMLDYGFRKQSLDRVWAEMVADNTAAARLVEKAGMRKEKSLPQHKWMKDRWWDTLVYGIHYTEWHPEAASYRPAADMRASSQVEKPQVSSVGC